MDDSLTKSECEARKAIYRLTEMALRLTRARSPRCPHGFPIPARAEADLPATPALYDLDAGDVAEVALSGSTDPELVAFLGTLGLVPGVQVEVVEKHPFDGPLVVTVDGYDRALGERVARQIYVTGHSRPDGSGGSSTRERSGAPSTHRKQP